MVNRSPILMEQHNPVICYCLGYIYVQVTKNLFRFIQILLLSFLPLNDTFPDNNNEKNKLKIIVGGDFNFAPLEFLDNDNSPNGFNIDLLNAIADEINIEFLYRLSTWHKIINEFNNGDIDLLSLYYSDQRLLNYKFAEPHIFLFHVIVVRSDSDNILSLTELTGKKVIVQRDRYLHSYLLSRNDGIELILVDSEIDALKLLSSGLYDCAIVNINSYNHATNKENISNIYSSGAPFLSVEYCFAVNKENEYLIDTLNYALTKIRDNGKYEEIYTKWFIQEPELSLKSVIKYAAWILIPLLFFGIAGWAWTWTLNNKVKKATESLKQELKRNKLLSDIFDNTKVGIVIGSKDGNTLELLNQSFAEMHGYTVEELTGKPINSVVAKISQKDLPLIIEKANLYGHHIADSYHTKKDGTIFPVSIDLTAVKDQNGDILYRVVNVQDITDRKLKELQIDSTNKSLQTIINASPLAIIDLTLDGRIRSIWNPAAEKIFGWKKNEVIGKIIPMITRNQKDILISLRKQLLENNYLTGNEIKARTKYGTTIDILLSCATLVDSNKIPYGIMAIINDITDRINYEEEIKKFNLELEQKVIDRTKQLHETNTELEAFAYSVSHDLRAPLRHINGFIDLLGSHLKDTSDIKVNRYMDVIGSAANKMGILIDELLTFSRMARVELKLEHINLYELVNEVIEDMKFDYTDRKIHWSIQQLPSVKGDKLLLKQVYVNLISNSLKFTKYNQKTNIEINYKTKGKYYLFSVEDNGVGFNMQYKDKLFGVFQRLHKAEDFEGTGIGLAIVKRIVHRHNGTVDANSELNKGTVISFTIPYNQNN